MSTKTNQDQCSAMLGQQQWILNDSEGNRWKGTRDSIFAEVAMAMDDGIKRITVTRLDVKKKKGLMSERNEQDFQQGRLDGLRCALAIVSGRRARNATDACYTAALDDITIFLDTAIDRTERG